MGKLLVVAFWASFVSVNFLGAQTTSIQPQSPSGDSRCTLTDRANLSWISCQSIGGELVPLEEQSAVLPSEEATPGKPIILVFSGEKSPSRVKGDQKITIKFRSLEDVVPKTFIRPLQVKNGTRRIDLGNWSEPAFRWHVINKTTLQISGVDPLPPGEYVVLIGNGNEPVSGDEAFLFGVD